MILRRLRSRKWRHRRHRLQRLRRLRRRHLHRLRHRRRKCTIPSGTTFAVRLVDAVDSETATQGQTFHATLNSALAVDGATAIPAGYSVEGHVVTVQSAGKFAGQSLLVLQLDRIVAGGSTYNLQTDQ